MYGNLQKKTKLIQTLHVYVERKINFIKFISSWIFHMLQYLHIVKRGETRTHVNSMKFGVKGEKPETKQ